MNLFPYEIGSLILTHSHLIAIDYEPLVGGSPHDKAGSSAQALVRRSFPSEAPNDERNVMASWLNDLTNFLVVDGH